MNAGARRGICICSAASLIAACASPAAVESDAYGLTWKRYGDAHALDNLRIAEALEEKALVGHQGYRASQLVIVTRASPASLRQALVERIESRPGLESAADMIVDAAGMFHAIRPSAYSVNDGDRARELNDIGVEAARVPLTILASKPFNIGVVKESASVIKLQIVDAAALGAPSGAFVFLQRVDNYEAFTTNWPHVFIPLWHHVSGPLVTTTERSLVNGALAAAGNPPTRMFTSGGNTVNRDLIAEGVRWLAK